MKEESDTPFSFNPGDNIGESESSSFFAANKKLLIIIAVMAILLIAIHLKWFSVHYLYVQMKQ